MARAVERRDLLPRGDPEIRQPPACDAAFPARRAADLARWRDPAALARTGRLYDGWLPYPPDPADYQSGLQDIRNAAVQAGRSAAGITPALFVSVRVDSSLESGRRALGDYATASYGMPLEELEKIQAVITGTPQCVIESLSRYIAAGARHVVVRLGALDLHSQRDQLERVAALIPSLRDAAKDRQVPDTM